LEEEMKISKEEKAMWLEDWQKSGKNPWAYARENGLVPQTFTSWVRPKKRTKQSFVEVPSQALQSTNLEHEILIEKGEIKIHIPLSVWAHDSRAVMEGLGAVL
jgi:transposase-like protein